MVPTSNRILGGKSDRMLQSRDPDGELSDKSLKPTSKSNLLTYIQSEKLEPTPYRFLGGKSDRMLHSRDPNGELNDKSLKPTSKSISLPNNCVKSWNPPPTEIWV